MSFQATSKSVPQLRFSEFNYEWEGKLLGKIAKLSKGKGISKADIELDGKHPCIRYGELYTSYGTVIDNILSFTNVEHADLILSEGGEVIIPSSGETALDIATASVVKLAGIALGGDLNIIKANVEGDFLAYYLIYKKRIPIARLAQGISVIHLYSSQLSKLKLHIPKIEEQRKIAAFLGAVEEKLGALRRKRELLEEYKRGVMQKVFSQEVRFRDNAGNPFPNWEKMEVSNIMTESRIIGTTGDKAKKITVKLWGNGVFEKEDKGQGSKNTQYYKRKAGQFIYSKLDFLNCAFGIIPEYLDGFQSTLDLPCFDIAPQVNQTFILEYIKQRSFYIQYGAKADGSRKAKRIHADTFLGFPILLPHLEEQQKIANFLTAIDNRIAAVDQQIEKIETFKKGLLQQMFV